MTEPDQDKIPTTCGMCYNQCSVLATVRDGTVRYIEGNPDSPLNRGKQCAKGKAGIMNLYNPNRVRQPLVRTNEEKGYDVDPEWREVSWDEALNRVESELGTIVDEPSKLLVHCWDHGQYNQFAPSFGLAFGTPHVVTVMSSHCGKSIHPVEEFVTGGFHQEPDFHYCEYYVLVGTQQAIASRTNLTHNMSEFADARQDGAKLVVVDPVGNYAAGKADEWLPIKPGTDAAFALAFMHVLVHELGEYDEGYLKYRTSAPYLVNDEKLFVRDDDGNPLVWDRDFEEPRPYTDYLMNNGEPISGLEQVGRYEAVDGIALSGEFEVDGERCRPAFSLFREHLTKYTPEYAESLTDIPAETLRRIATEFAEAACIGETIEIDGETLPYRPAVIDWAKGPQSHKHSFHHSWALKLINVLVGAVEVPGGILGTGARANYPREFGPTIGKDGIVDGSPGGRVSDHGGQEVFFGREVKPPNGPDLLSLYPMAPHGHTLMPLTNPDPEQFGLEHGYEMAMFSPGNFMLSAGGNRDTMDRFLRSLGFVVQFAIDKNAVSKYADVLLPHPPYLQQLGFPTNSDKLRQPHHYGDDRFFQIRQPVVDTDGVKQPGQALIELADRLDIQDGLYRAFNRYQQLEEPHVLEEDKFYDYEAVLDTWLRSWFGGEHGLAWFKRHGLKRVPKDLDEVYTGAFEQYRVPLILEPFVPLRDTVVETANGLGLDWSGEDYTAFPEQRPIPGDDEEGLIAVNYKLPFVYGAHGHENPWINELCELDDHAYGALINITTATELGIEDGDQVRLESRVGKQETNAVVTDCIHPEVVGVAGHFGTLSDEMPISHGKGVAFNDLLPQELGQLDEISTALEKSVRVTVTPIADDETERMAAVEHPPGDGST